MNRNLLALLFFFNTLSGYASSINISPTRLFLTPQQPITVLKITNLDEKPVLVQLQIKRWLQKEGHDVMLNAKDILVTPPIFRLPSQKTQLIRLANLQNQVNIEEKAYRIYLKEVVPKVIVNSISGEQVRVALNISVPLFVQPVQCQQQIIWSVKNLDANHLHLQLQNRGNITAFVDKFQIFDAKQMPLSKTKSTFAYILPKQIYSWVIPAKQINDLIYIKAHINGESIIQQQQG